MRNLFDFIIKHSHVFLFFILEIVCIIFLYQTSSYRKWAIHTATKEISGPVLKFRAVYREYMHLKSINEQLLKENSNLINTAYNSEISMSPVQMFNDTNGMPVFDYFAANVIENTTHKQSNYIVLDRGSKDSVKVDMGVITHDGIVGIVKDVSPNFCIVLSVLHKDFSISAKLATNDISGILVWNGQNHTKAQLKNISSIENIKIGDTLLTQHSLIFPENYPIGTVFNIDNQSKGGYYTLDVLLSEKLDRTNKVWIIKNNYYRELTELKEKVADE